MHLEINGHVVIGDRRERDENGRLVSQPLTEKEIRAVDHLRRRANPEYISPLKDLTLKDRLGEIREEIRHFIKRG